MCQLLHLYKYVFIPNLRLPKPSSMKIVWNMIDGCTLSDKISADKIAENLSCCWKFWPPKKFFRLYFSDKVTPDHRNAAFFSDYFILQSQKGNLPTFYSLRQYNVTLSSFEQKGCGQNIHPLLIFNYQVSI